MLISKSPHDPAIKQLKPCKSEINSKRMRSFAKTNGCTPSDGNFQPAYPNPCPAPAWVSQHR